MNSYNIGLEDRKIIEEMYNAGAKPCEIVPKLRNVKRRFTGKSSAEKCRN